MTLTFPTVHLNGTDAESLIEGYRAAHRALDAALSALSATTPNGRDYYVAGPHATTAAINEHCARLAKIEAVQAEIYALWESVDEQQDARSSRRAS